MWDGTERRKFPRVQYPCLITVRKPSPPSFSILTHTENLSIGGVRVIVREKVKITTEVNIEIDLMDTLSNLTSKGTIVWVKPTAANSSTTLSANNKEKEPSKDVQVLTGTVAWVKEIASAQQGRAPRYDIGIKFVALHDDDRRRIERIIEHLLRKGKTR